VGPSSGGLACGYCGARLPGFRLAGPMQEGGETSPGVDVRRLRAAAVGNRGAGRRHARTGWVAGVLRVVVPVTLAAVALVAAVVAGVRWAKATAPAPARVVDPVPAQVRLTPIPVPTQADGMLRRAVRADADWPGVLRELDRRRTIAFHRGDAEGLHRVYRAGSPALREDAADLAELAAAGLRARGLRLDLGRVSMREVAPGQVLLDVVDRMPAYDVVDRSGRPVSRVPGRGDRQWLVTLVPASDVIGEWRIAAIAPAPLP
jgi:hypothetical protein